MVIESMKARGHENVLFCVDGGAGLRAIIAVHSTRLGPALGGIRRWHYATETQALDDVLRLSEGMTYKAAAADLPMGGAKSVIWKPATDTPPTQNEAVAMARFVDRLGGLYIAAEDVGVTSQYIDWMAPETRHVMGGVASNTGGDPSPWTARGVVAGMRAGVAHAGLGAKFKGLTVAIRGVGAVGWKVAEILHSEGAALLVADIDPARVRKAEAQFGAKSASPADILSAPCDVFCPCALGGVISGRNARDLRAKVVAGGANNVLVDPVEDGAILKSRAVVYCPDFVINGGGLIRLAGLWCGFSEAEIDRRVRNIEKSVATILRDADRLPSAHEAAVAYAEKRLAAGRPLEPAGG